MTAYIIQFIMFQLLFLLVYETLLKKETFFTWNRIYLLVTAVVSLLLPLVKIEALSLFAPPESFSAITTEWLPEIFIGNTPHTIEHLPAVEISAKSSGINWWLMVYLLGFLGSILLVFKKYKNLERLFRFKTISAEKEWRIIEIPNSTIACSFYKTIFLGDQLTEAEKGQILSHELVHVKQKHSLDLVFFEILKIIFWFNPLIYIYQNRIATLHEFIADAAVVKNTEKRSYYEHLLNSAFSTTNISFINQFFNRSLIKERIIMLQKAKSKTVVKFKYLILIPLILAMLSYVSCSDDINLELPGDQIIIFPGCEGLASNEERKACMDEKIREYLNQQLDDGTLASMVEEMRKKMQKNFILSLANYDGSEIFLEGKEDRSSFPYAVIDEVPAFPGCEDIPLNEERKLCTTQKILEFVSDKFDMSIRNRFGLPGINRVIVQFKIDENGNIQNVKSRAASPELEIEAERVINSLPAMTPGKQNGEIVGVIYSLPIEFKLDK